MALTRTNLGRRILFSALYFSEGAPIGFVWWAIPTLLKRADVPIERITALVAVLALPWALKFLWAPLVDVLRGRRIGYRAWIITAQLLMGLTLAPLMFLDLHADFPLVFSLLLLHALAAATQDVAIDAWAISAIPHDQRGRINGFMQAGMLAGRWLFSSGPLLVGAFLGPHAVIPLLIAGIWITMPLVILGGEAPAPPAHHVFRDRMHGFFTALANMLTRRNTWLGLFLAAIGGAGFELVGATAGPFLVDHGFSDPQIAAFYTANVVAMLTGALLGGLITDRIGHRRAVAFFLTFLAALILIVSLTDSLTTRFALSHWLVFASLIAVYFGIGLFTASTYALFMDLTDPRLGGTQFSAFMGATNACESWSAYLGGSFIAARGYPLAYAAMAILSLLALPAIVLLRSTPAPAPPDDSH